MNLPRGRLVQSRVVEDPGRALRSALDRTLTGYALFEPQDTLLLDAEDTGVIAFDDGIPVAAAHAGTGRGGPPALADLALPGPYSVELHALDPAEVQDVAADADLRVPPGMPAERLAGDPDLADRTRRAAPVERDRDPATGSTPGGDRETSVADDATRADGDAVAAFLDDEEKIDAIRQDAREQARQRAAEWDLDGQLE